MRNKASLKDIKSHNRCLILQSVLNGQGLSRIALSRKTGLSPSTVTSLVSELLDQEVLAESGLILSTGGRGRKELIINPAYGHIAVIEISRQKAVLCIYNMSLEKLKEQVIVESRTLGSNLFLEICSGVTGHFHEKEESPKLAGIGLLFLEDMIESDLNVMFSTSLSSDNVSLKEALYTQFKVPVIGDYSVGELLQTNENDAKNSVHIAIANKILVNLTIDGNPIKMNEGLGTNIGRLLPSHGEKKQSLISDVAEILALLCGMFSLDLILLSGEPARDKGFLFRIHEILSLVLTPEVPPPIRLVELPDYNFSKKMAVQMRRHIFGIT